MNRLNFLPDSCLQNTAQFLDIPSVVALSSTSRDLHAKVDKNRLIPDRVYEAILHPKGLDIATPLADRIKGWLIAAQQSRHTGWLLNQLNQNCDVQVVAAFNRFLLQNSERIDLTEWIKKKEIWLVKEGVGDKDGKLFAELNRPSGLDLTASLQERYVIQADAETIDFGFQASDEQLQQAIKNFYCLKTLSIPYIEQISKQGLQRYCVSRITTLFLGNVLPLVTPTNFNGETVQLLDLHQAIPFQGGKVIQNKDDSLTVQKVDKEKLVSSNIRYLKVQNLDSGMIQGVSRLEKLGIQVSNLNNWVWNYQELQELILDSCELPEILNLTECYKLKKVIMTNCQGQICALIHPTLSGLLIEGMELGGIDLTGSPQIKKITIQANHFGGIFRVLGLGRRLKDFESINVKTIVDVPFYSELERVVVINQPTVTTLQLNRCGKLKEVLILDCPRLQHIYMQSASQLHSLTVLRCPRLILRNIRVDNLRHFVTDISAWGRRICQLDNGGKIDLIETIAADIIMLLMMYLAIKVLIFSHLRSGGEKKLLLIGAAALGFTLPFGLGINNVISAVVGVFMFKYPFILLTMMSIDFIRLHYDHYRYTRLGLV